MLERACRFPIIFALSATLWGCSNFQAPESGESWLAELTQSQQILTMRFGQSGELVSGSAALARLTEPGAEALTLAGTRLADTLDISFVRDGVRSFRLLGWYVNNRTRITGTLTGAEFTDLGVLFRRQ